MNPERKKHWKKVRLITLPTIERKNFDTIFHSFLATIHVLFQPVDVIHYHSVGPSTLAWIPRVFKPGVRVVATFHARDRFHEKWRWPARVFLAFGEWAICHFPHVTITVSHGLQLYCQKMHGRDAVHIPNAVVVPSNKMGASKILDLGLQKDGYFILLGRLIPVKAFDDAIRAFKKVETKKKMLIVGDVSFDSLPYKIKLETLADDDERVILTGFRKGKELQELLANCYAMIHPARSEGLSMAVLEAMSYGKLVIMSNIQGNRELVDHSGIAYPVGNISALQDAIEWVISDPILTHIRGKRAKKVVKDLYSWDRLIERTESVYKRPIL